MHITHTHVTHIRYKLVWVGVCDMEANSPDARFDNQLLRVRWQAKLYSTCMCVCVGVHMCSIECG